MRYVGVGVEVAGAVILFTLLGWWVDGRFGTEPWGILIGAFIGLGGGMYNLVREGLEAARTSGGSGEAGDGAPKPPRLDKPAKGGPAGEPPAAGAPQPTTGGAGSDEPEDRRR